jgi:uncharacterized protein YggE
MAALVEVVMATPDPVEVQMAVETAAVMARQVRSNTALLTDAFHSALRAARGAAKRER